MAKCSSCNAESNHFQHDCSVPVGWAWVGNKLYCRDCKEKVKPKRDNYGIPPHL